MPEESVEMQKNTTPVENQLGSTDDIGQIVGYLIKRSCWISRQATSATFYVSKITAKHSVKHGLMLLHVILKIPSRCLIGYRPWEIVIIQLKPPRHERPSTTQMPSGSLSA